MKRYAQAALAIVFMTLTVFMMMETRSIGALGDYALEALGLRSWTGDGTGFHLTILYFGALFLVSLGLVRKYAVEAIPLSKRTIFIWFVVLMILFFNASGAIAQSIKANSPGLLAIGYNAESSRLEYRRESNAYTAFEAKFHLTNYSDTSQSFTLSIPVPYGNPESPTPIRLHTPEGGETVYRLRPHESRIFHLTLADCIPVGGPLMQDGGGSGTIQSLILTNEQGSTVCLTNRDFWGTLLYEQQEVN